MEDDQDGFIMSGNSSIFLSNIAMIGEVTTDNAALEPIGCNIRMRGLVGPTAGNIHNNVININKCYIESHGGVIAIDPAILSNNPSVTIQNSILAVSAINDATSSSVINPIVATAYTSYDDPNQPLLVDNDGHFWFMNNIFYRKITASSNYQNVSYFDTAAATSNHMTWGNLVFHETENGGGDYAWLDRGAPGNIKLDIVGGVAFTNELGPELISLVGTSGTYNFPHGSTGGWTGAVVLTATGTQYSQAVGKDDLLNPNAYIGRLNI